MNGVRAELDEWTRENAKNEEGGKVLCKAYEGWKGRIAEWMALFMRTDFCSDVADPHWARKKGRVLGTHR